MEQPSNAALAIKLGVKPGDTLWLRHAPSNFVLEVPAGVTIRRRTSTTADVVVAFYTRSSTLAGEIDALSRAIFPTSSLWVAWPKRAALVATDLSDYVVRDLALPLGLVDNKVCAIDETWSGLRLVWRVTRRASTPSSRGSSTR
jgi:hypothetical protein